MALFHYLFGSIWKLRSFLFVIIIPCAMWGENAAESEEFYRENRLCISQSIDRDEWDKVYWQLLYTQEVLSIFI